jgi:hypothetical protein
MQAQKEKKQKPDKTTDENGEPMNPFAEMLRVMDIEYLIRFRRRLEKVGRKRMVEILTDEIEERQALEKQHRDVDRVRPAQR